MKYDLPHCYCPCNTRSHRHLLHQGCFLGKIYRVTSDHTVYGDDVGGGGGGKAAAGGGAAADVGGVFECEYDCGFYGGKKTVEEHEKTCGGSAETLKKKKRSGKTKGKTSAIQKKKKKM